MLANQVVWTRKLNELDDYFHATIFHGLHRKNTWNAISQMSSNYHRMINLTRISSHHEHLIAEHKEILSINEKKELERVDSVLRNHILKPIKNWGK